MPTPPPPLRRTVARRVVRRSPLTEPPAKPAATPQSGSAPEPGSTPQPAAASQPASTSQPAAAPREWQPWVRVLALVGCAVVLSGLAAWFARQAHELRTAAGAANTALTDNAATSEAKGQVTSAVTTLFSYSYTDLDKNEQAARTLLTGKAVCQYNQLFAVVKQQAPKQHLVVTVTVTNSGVELLTGDRARVLVFATQSDTSTATKQTATAGAMFAVDALRQDGAWKVDNIDTFSGEAPTAACR